MKVFVNFKNYLVIFQIKLLYFVTDFVSQLLVIKLYFYVCHRIVINILNYKTMYIVSIQIMLLWEAIIADGHCPRRYWRQRHAPGQQTLAMTCNPPKLLSNIIIMCILVDVIPTSCNM